MKSRDSKISQNKQSTLQSGSEIDDNVENDIEEVCVLTNRDTEKSAHEIFKESVRMFEDEKYLNVWKALFVSISFFVLFIAFNTV